MGAWIEIERRFYYEEKENVAPFMGAWIEIRRRHLTKMVFISRTLHGCVD